MSSTGLSANGKALHFFGISLEWSGFGWLRNFRIELISSGYVFIIVIEVAVIIKTVPIVFKWSHHNTLKQIEDNLKENTPAKQQRLV
jgi:hypothetical protein